MSGNHFLFTLLFVINHFEFDTSNLKTKMKQNCNLHMKVNKLVTSQIEELNFPNFDLSTQVDENKFSQVYPRYIPKRIKLHWHARYMANTLKILPLYLKWTDFIILVQDARIPKASQNIFLESLLPKKPLIRVFTHSDLSSEKGNEEWASYYRIQNAKQKNSNNTKILFLDAQKGDRGIILLKKFAREIGSAIQEKRIKKGLLERPIRGILLGYPNTGKSALLNRLLGRRKSLSYNIAGVTKQVKLTKLNRYELSGPVYKQLELVDTPGIFPPKLEDQESTWQLAICNSLPENQYDLAPAAEKLLDLVFETWLCKPKYIPLRRFKERYKVDPLYHGLNPEKFCGEVYLEELSQKNHHGDLNAASMRLLTDFRKGYLGKITLQKIPKINDTSRQNFSNFYIDFISQRNLSSDKFHQIKDSYCNLTNFNSPNFLGW